MQSPRSAALETTDFHPGGPLTSVWQPASRADVLFRLAERIGAPLVCLEGNTGRRVAESHPATLSCVPAACLLRLPELSEPKVIELSQGLLTFVGPLPGMADRQLWFAGVALAESGCRPGELVLAAIEAGWTNERLDDWISQLPVLSAVVLERLVRLAFDHEQQAERLQARHRELETLSRQVDAAYRQIGLFHALAPRLQLTEGPDHLAEACLERLKPLVPAGCHLICLDRPGSEPLLLTAGHLPFEDTALLRMLARFEDHDWSAPLIRNRTAESPLAADFPALQNFIAASIRTGDVCRGWIISCNERSGRGFGALEAKLLSSIATVLATHLSNIQLYWENDELLLGFVKSLVSMLDARDPYTRGHSERVALIARQLAEQLELPAEEVDLIYMSGLLHDIGKLGVDDRILRKEAPLTREEFRAVQNHPELGCEILRPLRNLKAVLPGVRSHHEMWNGAGYPEGLRGEAIPRIARIIAVADAFDAMTSDRPYRPGMSVETLEQIFREGSGAQWDPVVIEAYFARNLEIQRQCQAYSAQAGNLLRDAPTVRSSAMPRSVLRR